METTTPTLLDKFKVKQALIDHHLHVIEDLKAEIEAYHSQADLDEGDTMDPEDYSHQSDAQFVERSLTQQLKKTEEELSFLDKLSTEEHDAVQIGSLVEFDDRCIYVALAAPPFKLEGKQVICISASAPAFNLLKDKKSGDAFKLGKEKLMIQRIY